MPSYMPNEVPNEVPNQVPNEVPNEVPNQVPNQVPNEVPVCVVYGMPRDIVAHMPSAVNLRCQSTDSRGAKRRHLRCHKE